MQKIQTIKLSASALTFLGLYANGMSFDGLDLLLLSLLLSEKYMPLPLLLHIAGSS